MGAEESKPSGAEEEEKKEGVTPEKTVSEEAQSGGDAVKGDASDTPIPGNGSTLRANAPVFRPSNPSVSPQLRPEAVSFTPSLTASPGLQPSALPFVPGRPSHISSPDLAAISMNAAAHAAYVPVLEGGLGGSALEGQEKPRRISLEAALDDTLKLGFCGAADGAKIIGQSIEWTVAGDATATSPAFTVGGVKAWSGKGAGKNSARGPDVPMELVYTPADDAGPQVTLQTADGQKKKSRVRLKFELKVGTSSSGSKAIMAQKYDVTFPKSAAGAQTITFTPIDLIR